MADTLDIEPLPQAKTREGALRHVGIEIEMGGLPEEQVARLIVAECGGRARQSDGKLWTVEDSELGRIEVFLDSRYITEAETFAGDRIRDIARTVVPVELVTEPILPEQIVKLDRVIATLREHGATGTKSGLFLGFGVHFNPEIVSRAVDDILPVLTAFALIEDSLRRAAQIDLARRALPFVSPYPRGLIDDLAGDAPPDSVSAMIDLYLRHTTSRNHALDMLALFAWLDEDRVAAAVDLGDVSSRPTFHFRLPDCRIDDPAWSLAEEWARWVRVERLAGAPETLDRLKGAWRAHRSALTTMRGDWAPTADAILQEAGI